MQGTRVGPSKGVYTQDDPKSTWSLYRLRLSACQKHSKLQSRVDTYRTSHEDSAGVDGRKLATTEHSPMHYDSMILGSLNM
eukprot:g47556.t1